MKYRRMPREPHIFRIPRGGAPPEECPLKGGEEVPFLECLECEYFIDFDSHQFSHCGIKEEDEKQRRAKKMEEKMREQEAFEREIAERDRKWEEADRKMREEMAAMRAEMEKDRKKWKKEYEKEQEEYERREEERMAAFRRSLVELYGEDLVESSERFIERMGSGKNKDEEDDDDKEEEED